MRLPSTHSIKRKVLVKKPSSNSIQENWEPIQKRWKVDNVEKDSNKMNLSNAISQRWPLTFSDDVKTRDVRLRRVIVISVKTKLGNFEEQSVFSVVWSVVFFSTSFKQALGERYGRKRSRSCSFACFEEHCTGWPCLFQNGNWKILSVSTRLKGEFPLLRCVWPVKITPHFSRTVNFSLQGHSAYQEFEIRKSLSYRTEDVKV